MNNRLISLILKTLLQNDIRADVTVSNGKTKFVVLYYSEPIRGNAATLSLMSNKVYMEHLPYKGERKLFDKTRVNTLKEVVALSLKHFVLDAKWDVLLKQFSMKRAS